MHLIALWTADGRVPSLTIVDEADYDDLDQWIWRPRAQGYAGRSAAPGGTRIVYLHRQLMGLDYGDQRKVDHINRNRLDNRRANLRIVDDVGNGQNQTPQMGRSSEYRGVCWDKGRQKWMAYSGRDGRRVCLGRHETEAEAAAIAAAFRARFMPCSEEASAA